MVRGAVSMDGARSNGVGHGRPPDWRWRRAEDLVERGRRLSTRRDDSRVREAVHFIRRLRRTNGEAARRRLTRYRSDLAAAYTLFVVEPSRARWELEARLLTDQPFDEIAVRLGMTCDSVAWYHDLYCDVRGRLNARDWVATHLLGRDTHVGMAERDIGRLLKLYAFQGGILALESLLEYFRNPPVVPDRPELLDPESFCLLCEKLTINASILSRAFPIDSPSALKKLALLREATERIHHAGKQFAAADALTGLPAMATELPALDVPFAGLDARVAADWYGEEPVAREPKSGRDVPGAA
jgi:hypothetical protein